MPIYEYRCDKGHEVDVIQPMSEDALTECPECGAPTRRVLHSPAIHFKGSGFHNTDYGTRTGNKQKQAAASAKKDSGGDSSSTSSDSQSSSSGSSSSSSDSSSSSSDKKSNISTKDASAPSK
ncbi:MAG: FmdB family transcriptional regulator [Solirubrobacterales bacterium]|nr:FmdB family transcriptional regulator [Solirubrobacterales bacterium]